MCRLLIVQMMSVCIPLFAYGINIHADQTINTYPFSCMKGSIWNRCVLECVYVTMCKSFAYKEDNSECVLYDKTITDPGYELMANYSGYTWADVNDVLEIVSMDPCVSKPCGMNERCYPTTPYLCRYIDCGQPRSEGTLPTDLSVLPGESVLASYRPYYCHSIKGEAMEYYDGVGFTDCQQNSGTTCMANYQWADIDLNCQGRSTVYDCESVRACNKNYGDGEYWVYREGRFSMRMKVYCHNMSSEPVMYLSLSPNAINYATITRLDIDIAMTQRTDFSKIRIKPYYVRPYDQSTLKVITDDFEFSTSTVTSLPEVPMGSAGGCLVDGVLSYGTFNIDLTGTTFQSTVNNSWISVNSNVTMNNFVFTNYTTYGECSDLLCLGHCAPEDELSIEIVTDHDVPESSATVPSCP